MFIRIMVLLAAVTTQALAAPTVVDSPLAIAPPVPGSFIVLSYHEVRDDVRDYPDPYAVDAESLVRQFAWLRSNGYVPVSLDAIVKARRGGPPLPDRAVLLTFDDAYLSFYTRVYPLLREFGYPALLAVVGKWIDVPHATAMPYGEKGSVVEASFPSWAILREMANSGLVELASHSYDLHQGVPANPQGNLQPAATARIYDAATGSYESDTAWRARVRADIVRSADVIERNTGKRPRAIVWPYGSYNQALMDIAADSGMSIGVTLDDGINTPEVSLATMRRTLIEHFPTLPEFAAEVRGARYRAPIRVIEVSLDDVYSSDPERQESNLSALLDRIETLKPTHVFLHATTAPDQDGRIKATYFPNHGLPMRGDLFNRAAWQLASRADVKVFAVMPLAIPQLSKAQLTELYEELGRHASFDGLVFDEMSAADFPEAGTVATWSRQLATRCSEFHMPMPIVRKLRGGAVALAANDAGSLAAYDYVALVMPLADGQAAGTSLPNTSVPPNKLIVMLQLDPYSSEPASREIASRQMTDLQLNGVINFGYITAGSLYDGTAPRQLAPAMSLRLYPQRQRAKD
ncbi:MAG TPA: poly-beta-1,6-N-acetyl-D-glucosamine N-deacetylase PgaB [Rhodocyclaceae bacterium]|nr:poly-beta-1,6-N-acetyl-D-glucosamine N-deacetylase PgaB [Rhodocyclaceae bacterium]